MEKSWEKLTKIYITDNLEKTNETCLHKIPHPEIQKTRIIVRFAILQVTPKPYSIAM